MRPSCRKSRSEHGFPLLIATPPTIMGYVHRLGQSQGCELCGLAERSRTRQLNGVPKGMGALGASIFWFNGAKQQVQRGRIAGQLGDAEKIR